MPFDHDKWWQALPLFSLIVLLLVLHESPSSLAMLTEQENASATQDDDSPSEDADEKPSPELETLGNSLKAAVISGNMDEKQAWEIWSTAVEEIKGGQNDKRMWQDRQRDKEYDDTNARQRMRDSCHQTLSNRPCSWNRSFFRRTNAEQLAGAR